MRSMETLSMLASCSGSCIDHARCKDALKQQLCLQDSALQSSVLLEARRALEQKYLASQEIGA